MKCSRASRAAVLVVVLLPLLAGCPDEKREETSWTEQAKALGEAKSETDERAAVLNPARRCSECHSRQFREWRPSAHARSASELYTRLTGELPKAEATACDACHIPLSEGPSRIAREGVSCDACHTATAASSGPIAVKLEPELATKFGPYDDSRNHHFHRVAFSPFVTGVGLCESCHSDRTEGPLPIFTSTAEWREGPHRDTSCQSCHMPKHQAEAAKGEKLRDVAGHGFGADKAEALAAAVKLTLVKETREGAPHVRVELLNAEAGHALPTDLPERRLLLVLEALDAAGKSLGRKEHRYGRRLVDAAGKPAPFFRAVKEAGGVRLWPGKPQLEHLALPRGTTRVTATLHYERFDPALSAVYGEHAPLQLIRRELAVEGP